MSKPNGKPHRRAYVNPLPGFGESEQRTMIDAKLAPIDEWYVQSRAVDRDNFIESLRPGDEAVVARTGCLARATYKRRDAKMADLSDARGDIHAKGAMLVSAEGLRSDKQWSAMKQAAKAFFVWLKNLANLSARKHRFTDSEIREMLIIGVDRRYKNWKDRWYAIKRKDIKPPGRTWFVQHLPIEASKRGITI